MVTSTQPTSLSWCAKKDSEGDVENVKDETGTFMESGSGYGTKSLYECWKEMKDDPYDDDTKYNVHDLSEDELAFCDALDIKVCSQKKS